MPNPEEKPVPENKDSAATPEPVAPEPADLEAFDLDGFIDGIVQPTKVVAIAQDRTLAQQLEEAEQDVADIERRERDAKAEGRPSKRRAATSESPELEQARAHLQDLQERTAGAFVFVRVQGVTRNVRKQAVKEAQNVAGDKMDAYHLAAIAHSARIHKRDPRIHDDEPGRVLTAEQWDRFAEAIGVLQWDHLTTALNEVSEAGVSPDFSQPASPSPDGGTSSKS